MRANKNDDSEKEWSPRYRRKAFHSVDGLANLPHSPWLCGRREEETRRGAYCAGLRDPLDRGGEAAWRRKRQSGAGSRP
jgi:hypothetical protein